MRKSPFALLPFISTPRGLFRYAKYVGLILGLVVGLQSFTYAATVTLTKVTTNVKGIAPKGNSDVPVLSFTAVTDTGSSTLASVTMLAPTASATVMGYASDEISSVSVYLDSNGDGALTIGTDSLLATKVYTSTTPVSGAQEITGLNQSITTTSKQYFITYNFSSDITITSTSKTTRALLSNASITSGDTLSPTASSLLGGSIDNATIQISGYETETATSQLPSVLITDTTSTALKIQALPREENVNALSITIRNSQGTFATDASTNQGIITVSLYQDDGDGSYDSGDTLLASKGGTSGVSIDSTSTVIFSGSNFPAGNQTLTSGTTYTYFVRYEVGPSTNLSTRPKADAQVTSFSGNGASSSLTMSFTSATPAAPSAIPLGGLTFSDLTNIVPSNNTFGPGAEVPVLRFDLIGESVATTVNTVTIRNTGALGYVTGSNQTNGITQIKLYKDTDSNGAYDASTDTLLGSQALGTVSGQTAVQATVTLNAQTPAGLLLPTSNSTTDESRTMFVIYTIGTGVTSSGVTANALVGDATASSNVSSTAYDLTLSGTLPASPSGNAASVTVNQTSLFVNSITSIAPTGAVQGALKVPMLSIQLRALAEVPSATISIKNDKSTFGGTGVSKVWLYKDVDSSSTFNSGDLLIAGITPTGNTTVSFPPVSLSGNTIHRLLVLYDIAQNATVASSNVTAQLLNIVGASSSAVLGGEVPVPKVPVTTNIDTRKIAISKVLLSNNSVTNSSGSFTASVGVTNSSGSSVTVSNVSPRFYAGSKGGEDISYQFGIGTGTTTSTISAATAIAASSTVTFNFTIDPSNIITDGTVYADGYVAYTADNSLTAERIRYFNGNDWVLAATTNATLETDSNRTIYSWTVPAYISTIQVLRNGTWQSFQNTNAVPLNSQMRITFLNTGTFIDPSSIALQLNGATVPLDTQSSSSNITTYSYDADTGQITLSSLGNTSGTVTLNVNDLNGNALTTTTLTFIASSTLQLSNALFYPNPYTPENSDLRIGFNLTKDATVTIYLYNSLGQRVYKEAFTGRTGYNIFSRNVTISGRQLSSGVYIAKLIAVDSSGNQVTTTSKLAVK